jgi:hypothetical protein
MLEIVRRVKLLGALKSKTSAAKEHKELGFFKKGVSNDTFVFETGCGQFVENLRDAPSGS